MTKTMVNFKTSPEIAKLIEIESAKRGYKSKSDFLQKAVIDALVGLEGMRHKDTLVDFWDILKPRLTSLINDKDLAGELISLTAKLQAIYCKERLSHQTRLQKRLTDHAIEAYLAGDNIIEATGYEGFVAMNCLVSIYDKLLASDVITPEQWKKSTEHYSFYISQGEGAQLLQQIQQE